jgi:tyrosyl-tRNA synthetase
VSIPPADVQFDLLTRGVYDLPDLDEFRSRLEESYRTQTPLVVKAGFDPTAPDLHLGHTVLLEKMAQFQRLGHDVVFLVGDYTALIGDPTGRNALRPPLSEEQIREHARTYTEQCFRVLDRSRTRLEWNSRWLSKLTYADLIRLTARYNLARMLERRDFRQRYDEGRPIAMHELLYPLVQGYDSVALVSDIELGGQDQIFNLNVGRHLMEAYGLRPQMVLTVPLLCGLDGQEKMSKSKGNHIGVLEAAEPMFGKVMSISDERMASWYPLLLGELALGELALGELALGSPLEAKLHLAHTLVARFHSPAVADDTLAWWRAGRPARNVGHAQVRPGALFEVVHRAGGASSGSDARRKIEQGGVSLDGTRVQDPLAQVVPGQYELRVGKRWTVRVTVA